MEHGQRSIEMELIETHTGVQTEGEDAADIVFPSGKSKLKASSPSPSRKNKRSRNVAKGDYGVTMACPSKAGSPPESHRTPLQAGLSKMVDASVRFHPDKDKVLKQGFAGQVLTPPELREMLRRLFRIKLTEPELSALFAYFVPDGGMELDGSMFIILFIKMGQSERDRQRAEHREAERLYMKQRARECVEGQRRSTAHEGSPGDEAAGVKWGPEDRESAMTLITEAAVTYDKYSPAAVSLDAFDGATMSPTMFREQLRRVFNVKLSPSQSAALVAAFDCDKGGAVDCSEFLTKLLITRFKERSRRLDAQREAERRRKEKKAKEANARAAESEAKARVQVDCTYSRADRTRGLAKVMEAAVNYDPTGPSAVGLGAFQVFLDAANARPRALLSSDDERRLQGENMTPYEFREHLRRVFNVRLTPAELSGVIHPFDSDEDGTVNVTNFSKAFFKMGVEGRSRASRERREVEAARAARDREEANRRELEVRKHNALQVDFSFSEDERTSAMAKITAAASRHDKNHPSAVALGAFGGARMEPHIFRDQLKRALGIKVSPAELGALIHEFEDDGDGMVSCPKFLLTFSRIGFRAKEDRRAERRKHDLEVEGRAAEEAARKAQEFAQRETLGVAHDFSEEDKASAMAKIADAASRYDKNHPSCLGLGAFQGAHMHPRVFKEQLKRVFGIKLNPNEFWAMVKEFDKDGSGNLSCADFLLTFFRSGFEARYKAVRRRRDEESARLRKAAKEADRRHAEIERKRALAGVAPYAEKDLDLTLELLIDAAARYERRQLGPAGMSAWEVKSMSPSEFKETLKHTLGLKVTPPQLGALTHLFGTGGGAEDGDSSEGGVFAPQVQIDVSRFLTTFFKMSAAVKGMSVGRDAALRIAEYRVALKKHLAQQEEVRRTIKAMRSNPPKRPHTVDSGLTRGARLRGDRRRGCGAMEPAERIRFQVSAARSTSRLDLSTWADRKHCEFILSKLPRTIWRLTFLTELWLTNNDLQTLPPQIGELGLLRTLGIGHNRIARLPGQLGSLPNLEQIFAEKNWLSTLPKQLGSCRRLRELRLHNNQLSRLPDCVPEMRGLELLDLRGNTIEALPPELKYLRALLDLDLDGNPIGPETPQVLFFLVNLSRLSLAETRLGPVQGKQLSAALRLDSLVVNPDAPPPPPPPSPAPCGECPPRPRQLEHQQDQQDQEDQPQLAASSHELRPESPEGLPQSRTRSRGRELGPSVVVPLDKLPEIRERIPGCSTRRLEGLHPVPSDVKTMVRAKATRRMILEASDKIARDGRDTRSKDSKGWKRGKGRKEPPMKHAVVGAAEAIVASFL